MTNVYPSIFAEHYIKKSSDNGNISFLNKINNKSISPITLYSLNNVYLVYRFGVVLTEDGEPIRDCFNEPTHVDLCLDKIFENNYFSEDCEELDDTEYAPIMGPWDYTFWHWIFEYIPRIIVCEESGFKGKYIIYSKSKFMEETFELLGISKDRLLLHNGTESFFIKNLFMPEPYFTKDLDRELILLNRLRDLFLENIDQNKKVYEKVYISRENATNGRRVKNEKEVFELLSKYGFTKLFMENMSFKEQIETIVNTKYLVGGHGSGMTHSLFIKPKSFICEFFRGDYLNYCINDIVDILNHNYFPLAFSVPENSLDQDITVNMRLLEITIKNGFENGL